MVLIQCEDTLDGLSYYFYHATYCTNSTHRGHLTRPLTHPVLTVVALSLLNILNLKACRQAVLPLQRT